MNNPRSDRSSKVLEDQNKQYETYFNQVSAYDKESSDILLSFIILSWNSEKYLVSCFDSILLKCQIENISYEIIVVDNGSSDKSRSIISHYQKSYPTKFKGIALHKNRGTTYSRNIACKQAKGEYICILDSDTIIKDGSLVDIIKTLSKNVNIGIIAPRLLLPDGSIQNSVKKFPTLIHKISKIPKALLKVPVLHFDFYQSFPFTENTLVDTAISACWFLRRNLFAEVGFFDEKIFYSPEDLDFCVRAWKKGFKILYYPSLKVLHDTQQISHTRPLSRNSLRHLRGLLYYFRKHGGWLSTNGLRKEILSQFR
jgi:GT2 family glycosyltransferase